MGRLSLCFGVVALQLVAGATAVAAQTAPPTDTLPLRILKHRSPVHAARFTPDGDALVAGSLDGRVRIWNVATGTLRRAFRAHATEVLALDVAPDGRSVATSGGDGEIIIWDLGSGRARVRFRVAPWCAAVRYHPDGQLALGCSDLVVHVIDPTSGRTVREIRTPGSQQYSSITAIAFSPHGQYIATTSPTVVWDWVTGAEVKQIPALLSMTVAFSSDGERMATGSAVFGGRTWSLPAGSVLDTLSARIDLRVWGPNSFPTVHVDMPLSAVAYAPRGQMLATGGVDQLVRTWNESPPPRALKSLKIYGGHEGTISDIVFSPDGKLLATASLDGTIRLWPAP
jgi:WD40 repeat protein